MGPVHDGMAPRPADGSSGVIKSGKSAVELWHSELGGTRSAPKGPVYQWVVVNPDASVTFHVYVLYEDPSSWVSVASVGMGPVHDIFGKLMRPFKSEGNPPAPDPLDLLL